jgi:hypothetical protein
MIDMPNGDSQEVQEDNYNCPIDNTTLDNVTKDEL